VEIEISDSNINDYQIDVYQHSRLSNNPNIIHDDIKAESALEEGDSIGNNKKINQIKNEIVEKENEIKENLDNKDDNKDNIIKEEEDKKDVEKLDDESSHENRISDLYKSSMDEKQNDYKSDNFEINEDEIKKDKDNDIDKEEEKDNNKKKINLIGDDDENSSSKNENVQGMKESDN